MRADAIVLGLAGIFFGVIVGWVLGSQQARGSAAVVSSAPAAAGAAQAASQPGSRAVPVDQERLRALQSVADQNPKDPQPRVQIGNMFFDAEQYPQSIPWYESA